MAHRGPQRRENKGRLLIWRRGIFDAAKIIVGAAHGGGAASCSSIRIMKT